MGKCCSFCCSKPNDVIVVMIGLESSGKTTLLHYMITNELVKNKPPTIGFTIEQIEYKNEIYTIWDVSGQEKVRHLWRHYYQSFAPSNIDGVLIWVVAANDWDRINGTNYWSHDTSSCEELHYVLNDSDLSKDTILLICSYRFSVGNEMTVEQIAEKLEVNKIKQPFCIQEIELTKNGKGVNEGLELIHLMLKAQNKGVSLKKDDDWKSWINGNNYKMKYGKRQRFLVSGWIRKINDIYQLNIPFDLTVLISQFHMIKARMFGKNHFV
eukprot:113157_1